MKGAAQLGLDLGVPPRTARHRPVGVQREDEALYRAVTVLRGAGRRVYRSGGQHRVDQRLLTTAELLRLAGAITRRIPADRETGLILASGSHHDQK